jgi:uncharacterized protein (DUF983 family)
MATATKSRTGFQIACPHCGASGEEGLTITAANLNVACSSCGEDVTRGDLERMVAEAQRLLRWLELAETI